MSPIAGREAVELKSDLSDWHPTKSKQANERNLAKRIFDSSYHVTSPVKARLVTKPLSPLQKDTMHATSFKHAKQDT